MISALLALANVFMAAGTAWMQFRCVCKEWRTPGDTQARIWRLLLAFVLVYWAVLYAYIFLGSPGLSEWCATGNSLCHDPSLFGQAFIRPANTMTLALLMALALRRWKGC